MTAVLLAFAVVGFPIPSHAADGFGCSYNTAPGWITVVDDVVVSDYDGVGTAPPAGLPAEEDILDLEIRCFRMPAGEAGAPPVIRGAIMVRTRSGAPALFEKHLGELVEEQRLYRERAGRYATSLTELNFFAGRTTTPIQLSTDGDGWFASVETKGVTISCRVAVGSAVTARAGLRDGAPACGPADR